MVCTLEYLHDATRSCIFRRIRPYTPSLASLSYIQRSAAEKHQYTCFRVCLRSFSAACNEAVHARAITRVRSLVVNTSPEG